MKRSYKNIFLVAMILKLVTPSLQSQPDSLSVIKINQRQFLSLIPEKSPDSMIWDAFGQPIESFYGLTAYSNGDKAKGRKYQCTELAHRFARDIYGIPTRIGMGLGHAKDLAKNMAHYFRNRTGTSDSLHGYRVKLEYFANQQTVYRPVVGSIVSMYFSEHKNGYGHIGVIREITQLTDSTLEAVLFDQHGFIHQEVGIPIQADKLYFTKDENGKWRGQVDSWVLEERFDLVGWINPVIVKRISHP
jgi:hypothetical protein